MKTQTIEVSYRQLCIFHSALQEPFNDWTAAHVEQGFAWRNGSVSFATLEEFGSMEIEINYGSPGLDNSSAARIIAVPFDVHQEGQVEIASILDGFVVKLPAGHYRLIFEHGSYESEAMWCRLSFEPMSQPTEAEVVRADSLLNPPFPLLMNATPAQ